MKIRKILSFGLIPSLLSLGAVISCQNTEKVLAAKSQITANSQKDEFNLFVKTNLVQTILNNIYKDEEAKTDYINSQINLLDSNYLNIAKGALRYANPITRSLNSQRSFSGNFWFKKTVADTFEKSDEVIEELFNKNWLFLLFHYQDLVFMQDQNAEGNDVESIKKIKESSENILLYGSFYKPKSNHFLDFVVQEYDNNEYSNIKKIFILTEDGFILNINLEIYQPQPKYDENYNEIPGETVTQEPSVEVFMYIFTYPKLLFSKNKTNDFDLKKYIMDTQSFVGFDEYGNDTKQVLFIDKYGGTELRYTVIDISNQNEETN